MAPQFLSGDSAAIEEFLSRFDVRNLATPPDQLLTVNVQVFLFDCDGKHSLQYALIFRQRYATDTDFEEG